VFSREDNSNTKPACRVIDVHSLQRNFYLKNDILFIIYANSFEARTNQLIPLTKFPLSFILTSYFMQMMGLHHAVAGLMLRGQQPC
jgi:hypothetical protein